MDVKEAAEYLTARGYRCSAGTVRSLVKSNKLRCWRGPSVRGPMQFPPEELDRFLRDELLGGGPSPVKAPAKKRQKVAAVTRTEPDGENWEAEIDKVWGA